MINPKELRIDNWVLNAGMSFVSANLKPRKINPQCFDSLSLLPDNWHPIPLTDEILEKCGFEACSDDGLFWYKGMESFTLQNRYLSEDGYDAKLDKWDVIPVIASVHQLQNLYYSLTGEELKYTP